MIDSNTYQDQAGPKQISQGIDLRGFDPDLVASYEAEGWKAYYARNWLRTFGLMVRLIQAQFHIPFPRSLLAAFHVVRATIAFAPSDHELDTVRRHLEQFYRLAAGSNNGAFDPQQVAELELRYWVVHRELAGKPDKRQFVATMAGLHAAIFGSTPAAMWPSALSRVEAANAVDQITSGRSTDVAADWIRVEEHLRRAYRQVKAAKSGT